MLGLLGSIFGSSRAFNKTLDNIAGTVDRFVYTDQEKAVHNQEVRAKMMDASTAYLESTKGQNLARRLIAVSVVVVWLAAVVLSAVLAALGLYTEAEIIHGIIAEVSTEIMVVFGFYFGAGALGKLGEAYVAGKQGGEK